MTRLFLLLLLFSGFVYAQNDDFAKAENLYQKSEFNKAKSLFNAHLKLHPQDLKAREYLGDLEARAKNWDTALSYYQELLDKEPQNANYNFKYGGALAMKALTVNRIRALTYIGEIKEHLGRAAELDPNHVDARWALIELYIQLPGIVGGSEKKAQMYASELQKVSPVDGYLSRGYIAEHYDRRDEAENYYKKGIEIGKSPHTYDKLTAFYEKNQQPKEALKIASGSLKVHKRNQTNYQIGKIAAVYEIEPQLGLESLRAYIKNHSFRDGIPVYWAHYRMAQIYRNEGDKTRAMHYIKLALSADPEFERASEEKKRIESLP